MNKELENKYQELVNIRYKLFLRDGHESDTGKALVRATTLLGDMMLLLKEVRVALYKLSEDNVANLPPKFLE